MDYLEKNSLMNASNEIPIWIDTDNAMGSYFGDIDDAIALATLIKAKTPIVGISNIFGNTFQSISFKQTVHLLKLLNVNPPHHQGADTWWAKSSPASMELSKVNTKIKILALGPLTNIALALKHNPDLKEYIEEIIFVGTNFKVQFPNWRFFDFNVFKDKTAAYEVLNSGVPITLIPCDQARKIRFNRSDIENVNGPVGEFFIKSSKRWFRRALFLKLQTTLPIWDLTAVLYLLSPNDFTFTPVTVDKSFFHAVKIKKTANSSNVRSLESFNTSVKNKALQILTSNN